MYFHVCIRLILALMSEKICLAGHAVVCRDTDAAWLYPAVIRATVRALLAVCRYAVRDSWDNLQLKQGAVAAFVVAKTSAAVTSVIEQSAGLALTEPALWSLVVDHLLKDTITFAAALVALQLAVQRQIVTPSSGPP